MSRFEAWLKDNVGFENGSPFNTFVADHEREALQDLLFVRVAQYQRIQDSDTIMVFGGAGDGKSAIRIRLSSLGVQGNGRQNILITECTNFDWLVDQLVDNGVVTRRDHCFFLFNYALQELFDLIFMDEKFLHPSKLQMIENYPSGLRMRLAAFFNQYGQTILERRASSVLETYTDIKLEMFTLQKAVKGGSVQKYLESVNALQNAHPLARLLVNLCDWRELTPADPLRGIVGEFQDLVEIVQGFGIDKLHFVIDRLDEMPDLINNPAKQVDLLESLLGYTRLLEVKGLGFKFLFAEDVKAELSTRSNIRHDRFLSKAVDLKWNDEDLRRLIALRFDYYSEGSLTDFTAVCHDDDYRQLEQELFKFAQRSPRRLLQGLHAIFIACYESQESIFPLQVTHWEDALGSLNVQGAVPQLYLFLKEKQAQVGDNMIKLTPIEVNILKVITSEDGVCNRQKLADGVWDGVVSESAIDKAISRLRSKWGDRQNKAVYLITKHGHGFRLHNYQRIN